MSNSDSVCSEEERATELVKLKNWKNESSMIIGSMIDYLIDIDAKADNTAYQVSIPFSHVPEFHAKHCGEIIDEVIRGNTQENGAYLAGFWYLNGSLDCPLVLEHNGYGTITWREVEEEED